MAIRVQNILPIRLVPANYPKLNETFEEESQTP